MPMARTTIKEEARELVERLPDAATWEDLQDEISARQRIETGSEGTQEGRTAPREDIRETLNRLSHSAGRAPDDVLRDALELFARDLEDRQAAERITPRTAELKAILARNPRPSTWHDSDEPLF